MGSTWEVIMLAWLEQFLVRYPELALTLKPAEHQAP